MEITPQIAGHTTARRLRQYANAPDAIDAKAIGIASLNTASSLGLEISESANAASASRSDAHVESLAATNRNLRTRREVKIGPSR